MAEKKRLKLKRKEIEIELEDEAGQPQPYVIRELSGDMREAFQQHSLDRNKTDKDGNPIGNINIKGLSSMLLSMSLFDAQGQMVPQSKIDKFPASTIDELLIMAREISGLAVTAEGQKKLEEEAKNV